MTNLERIVSELEAKRYSVIQPEGKEVADAYRAGKIDEITALHVLAQALGELRLAKERVAA